MDLSVVAAVASIAAGVSILVAIAAVVAARRSTAHADLALKEASRISRASISRINEVQSEASSARLAARHAAERLRSMTKERTTPDSVAAYRIFLKEVVEDSKHLLGPEGTGTMQNESLDRLRVGALVGGSDEVLRALRNFALLRTHRPEAPWPSAYAMAYARLESDLVTAIRNDLGSSEESLTADQIWGAVNARCVDPAFRLALLSPLEDVLRNAGQDPTHYDLDHIVKPADYPGPADFADSTAPTGSVSSAGAASSTGGHRRRSRRVQSRVAREASARATETAAAATGATTASTASTELPESDVVWTPLSPGHRGAHAADTGTSAATDVMSSAAASFAPPHEPTAASAIPAPLAPLQGDQPSGTEPSPAASVEAAQADALDGPPAASSADARVQAAAARQTPSAETTSRTAPTQPPETIPTSHRALETRSGAFEDPTPSRITRRRRAQESRPAPSTRAASAAPETTTSPTTAAPVRASAASWAPSSTAPTPGIPTASASTKETEAVRAPTLPTAPARSHAAEPGGSTAPGASRTPASQAASTEQPTRPQPQPRPTRTRSGSTPSTTSPVRAVAVAARTVTVTPGPQPSGASAAPTASARAAGAAETGGYGIITTPGTAQAPAQVQGRAGLPAPDPAGLPDLPEPQPAEQTSAVAAAGAVPTSAVGAHRAAAAPARAAVPTSPVPTTDPDTQETVTVPTAPRTPVPTAAPTATAWSFAPPSLQDSAEIPRARGA